MNVVKKLIEDGADINGLYYLNPPRIQFAPVFVGGQSSKAAHPSSNWPTGNSFSGYTPLMLAADRGNATIVQLLLEKGANPSIRKELDDKGRSSALYRAVTGSSSNQKVVRMGPLNNLHG